MWIMWSISRVCWLGTAVRFLLGFSCIPSFTACSNRRSRYVDTTPVLSTPVLGRSGPSPWQLHDTSLRGREFSRGSFNRDRHEQAPFCVRKRAKASILCLERAVSYAQDVQGWPNLGLDKPVKFKVPCRIPQARDGPKRNGRVPPSVGMVARGLHQPCCIPSHAKDITCPHRCTP